MLATLNPKWSTFRSCIKREEHVALYSSYLEPIIIKYTWLLSLLLKVCIRNTPVLLTTAIIPNIHTNILIIELAVKSEHELYKNCGASHVVEDPSMQQKRWSDTSLWKFAGIVDIRKEINGELVVSILILTTPPRWDFEKRLFLRNRYRSPSYSYKRMKSEK